MHLLLYLLLLAGLSSAGDHVAGLKACLWLQEDFPSQTFWPGSPKYIWVDMLDYFSTTCIEKPKCVFLPESAEDVAEAVKIVGQTKSPFAIRSGGHMTVPGGANVDYGVLIATSKMDTLHMLDDGNANDVDQDNGKDERLVRVGTGNLWRDVYKYVADRGRAVNGGRYGWIGTGGLTVGGGLGFFSSAYGFGADSVREFEVVLGNGDIVVANHHTRPDLFWALKGGSNYFGIVTRFDMVTFKAPEGVWLAFKGWKYEQDVQEKWFKALADYMAPGGGAEDVRAAIMPVIQGFPKNDLYGMGTIQYYAAPEPFPEAFKGFHDLNDGKFIDLHAVKPWELITMAPPFPSFIGITPRRMYWAVSFKPDLEAILIANRTVFGAAQDILHGVEQCTVGITYQPITKAQLAQSVAQGGNAINMKPEDGPFLAVVYTIAWEKASDDHLMYKFARESERRIREETKALGIDQKFTYVNDAGPEENPLLSYGHESVEKMRKIQQKYDKTGVIRWQLSHPFALY